MADLRERLEAILRSIEHSATHHMLARRKSSVRVCDEDAATLREVLAHPEKLMGEPHKPSGASIRCPRCGEKQEVVFKYAAPTKEVKP